MLLAMETTDIIVKERECFKFDTLSILSYNHDKYLGKKGVVLNINGKDHMLKKDEVIKVQPYQVRSGQETLTLGQPKNNKTVSHHIGIEIFILPFINFLFCYDSVVNYWSALLWNIAIIFLLGKGYSITFGSNVFSIGSGYVK